MSGCVMSTFAHTFEVMIAGPRTAGRRNRGAAHRDRRPGARSIRRTPDGPSHVVCDGRVHSRSHGRSRPRTGDTLAGRLARDIRHLLHPSQRSRSRGFHFASRRPCRPPVDGPSPRAPSVGPSWRRCRIRAALGYTVATGCVFAPSSVAYLSSSQQIFQEAYRTGALFPVYFGALALAFGGASLVNGWLVMKYGMRRLSRSGDGIHDTGLCSCLGAWPSPSRDSLRCGCS